MDTMRGLLNDREIKRLAADGMIDPFIPELVRERDGEKVISYGLSSAGYDIRAGTEWYIALERDARIGDPKNFDPGLMRRYEMDAPIVLPPRSFALTHSVERFRMPEDVVGIALGKSTYARMGIIVNITPLEPGWEGWLTIEVTNSAPFPVKVYPNEGIAQILFFRIDAPITSYAARSGKYQGQERGVVFARV